MKKPSSSGLISSGLSYRVGSEVAAGIQVGSNPVLKSNLFSWERPPITVCADKYGDDERAKFLGPSTTWGRATTLAKTT